MKINLTELPEVHGQEPQTHKIDLLTYFEIINRPKVTSILLVLSTFATLGIGLILFSQGFSTPGGLLIGFSLISILLLMLNLLGYQEIASTGLVILFPLLLTILMIEGEGLHDPGFLGFALFIIFSSLIRGKKFLPWAWLISVLLVVFIYLAEVRSWFTWTADMRFKASFFDLLTILIILTVGSGIFWVIMNIIETTMIKVIAGENQIKDAYDLTLEGWARALEMRDKETEGHSRRVTDLTLSICRKMGFSKDEIFHIRRGALLHDIGKMAVPDEILHKTGSLNAAEWEVVKAHPGHAYQMLKDIQFLAPALEIPLYHHERWDGGGYPQGLAGEEIPLPARIFSVVDHWDALLSKRPYREAWPRQQVIDYLKAEAGNIFDPQVVEIFLASIESVYDHAD